MFGFEAGASIANTLTNVRWCKFANYGRFIVSICQNTILHSLQYFDLHKFDSIKNAEKVFLRYRPYSEPAV